MCSSDDDYWLRELEQRADELNNALRGITGDDPADYESGALSGEPHLPAVFEFIDMELIPEINRALLAYERGETQIDMFNWQVDGQAVSVAITTAPDGLVVDSSMSRFARRITGYYRRLGYTVEPLDHQDDQSLMRPTRVRICLAKPRQLCYGSIGSR